MSAIDGIKEFLFLRISRIGSETFIIGRGGRNGKCESYSIFVRTK